MFMHGLMASKRLVDVPASPIREIMSRATELEAKGKQIIHFELGRPDFDTPQNIKDAAVNGLAEGLVHYTPNRGIPELTAAISDKLERENDVRVDPEREVVVTAGVSEALLCTFMAFLDPGDEVIIFEPAWPHYASCARLCGATPVKLSTHDERGFLPDVDAVSAVITGKTKLIVVNSPCNPTGAVYSAQLLEDLGRLVARHGLVLVSDEIYEAMVWEGRHTSAASIEINRYHTVTLNGFSKAYSMTGWRIGYAAAPAVLMSRILRVHQYNTVCLPAFSQWAAVEAYRGNQEWRNEMVRAFGRRRSSVLQNLGGIEGLGIVPPRGAFYVYPKLESSISATEFCSFLLEEYGVATVPGIGFSSCGEHDFRLSYATSDDQLQEGLSRIKDALRSVGVKA